MPRKDRADRRISAPGTYGRLLHDARGLAGKTVTDIAAACGLSPSYLTCIEQGKRSPIPDKVPMIAEAYGLNPDDACWSWIITFAPKMVRHLVTTSMIECSPFLQAHYRRSYVEQQAQEHAEAFLRAADRIRAKRAAAGLQDPLDHVLDERHGDAR